MAGSLSVTEKGGAFLGLSAVPERVAQQKAHVGGGRERRALRRETANSRADAAVSVIHARVGFSPISSESGILRVSKRLPS